MSVLRNLAIVGKSEREWLTRTRSAEWFLLSHFPVRLTNMEFYQSERRFCSARSPSKRSNSFLKTP